jgi:hypothetical protein
MTRTELLAHLRTLPHDEAVAEVKRRAAQMRTSAQYADSHGVYLREMSAATNWERAMLDDLERVDS